MAAYTKPSLVRAVLADVVDEIAIEPHIDSAHAIVLYMESKCSGFKAMSLSQRELVERWLAAHFYASTDPQYSQKSTGGASGVFQGQVAMYFEGTWYGQRAMEVDGSGCLSKRQQELKTGTKQSASISWAGKRPTEKLTFDERD